MPSLTPHASWPGPAFEREEGRKPQRGSKETQDSGTASTIEPRNDPIVLSGAWSFLVFLFSRCLFLIVCLFSCFVSFFALIIIILYVWNTDGECEITHCRRVWSTVAVSIASGNLTRLRRRQELPSFAKFERKKERMKERKKEREEEEKRKTQVLLVPT